MKILKSLLFSYSFKGTNKEYKKRCYAHKEYTKWRVNCLIDQQLTDFNSNNAIHTKEYTK